MTTQSPPATAPLDAASPPRDPARADAAGGGTAPSVVYLLADHLDAVLARGEDLLACSWRPDRVARCPETIAGHQDMQRNAIRAIRTHELLLISRGLKARERARELASMDGRFAPMARIFAAATATLEDAAREAGDTRAEQFDSGNGILAYLRSRGLVAQDQAAMDDCGAILVTPKFLVARRIELDAILDLTATFLDTLELHFDLYDEVQEAGAACVVPAPEAAPTETV